MSRNSDQHDVYDVPACAASMGCLCAGHARGDPADAPCDTREFREQKTTFTVRVTVRGSPDEAYLSLADALDGADAVVAYATDTYTDEDGEEVDTSDLMGD